ncbi:MAG: hypothetical protein H0T89_15775 [Deltaproteobacteria bacterium]|nr:hypothetical protein [Deltaproteobacteria bacterium]MDQ3295271.1 hypothetical protein [Myxococcota bacterium]
MIEIEVKGGSDPQALAELIAATLHGHVNADPSSPAVTTGKLVREHQAAAEQQRPSRNQLETVNFTKIDDDLDWTDVVEG